MAAELMTGAGHVLYLYGISQSHPAALVQQSGVDGHSKIESVESDGVTCWISRVSATEFGENLAANMENLGWIAETSVAHQRTISSIAHETDILPARLATVFRNDNSLLRHVRKQLSSINR